MQNVLAGTKVIGTKIRTAAERFAGFETSQSHTISSPGLLAGDDVINPGFSRVHRTNLHTFVAGSLLPLGHRSMMQFFNGEILQRHGNVRGHCEAQNRLGIQQVFDGRTEMITRQFTLIAIRLHLFCASGLQRDGSHRHTTVYTCVFDSDSKQIATEKNVAIRLDFILSGPGLNQLRPVVTEHLAGLIMRQRSQPLMKDIDLLRLAGFRFPCCLHAACHRVSSVIP